LVEIFLGIVPPLMDSTPKGGETVYFGLYVSFSSFRERDWTFEERTLVACA